MKKGFLFSEVSFDFELQIVSCLRGWLEALLGNIAIQPISMYFHQEVSTLCIELLQRAHPHTHTMNRKGLVFSPSFIITF